MNRSTMISNLTEFSQHGIPGNLAQALAECVAFQPADFDNSLGVQLYEAIENQCIEYWEEAPR